jgi:Mg2+/Co2+ transporter CorB
MTTALAIGLGCILVLLLLSAFFSGSETALTAASRPRIQHLANRGNRRAKLVDRLIESRETLIGAILLGNNAVNILASALATSLMISLFGETGVVYATIAMTFLVFVFAEVLPKTYAIRHADRMALAVSPVVRVLVAVLSPLTNAVQWLVSGLLRMIGAGGPAGGALSAEDELRGMFDLQVREGRVRKNYRDMLRSILDLSEVEVGEIMTHRQTMVTVDADLPVTEVVAAVLDSPYTRVPVWRDSQDNIVGVLHAKGMLRAVRTHEGSLDSLDVAELAYEPWFVPETTSLAEQLAAFRARHEHFALVVDEYGALQGLVTLEDILEEIVGDIADEHDLPTEGVTRQRDGSTVVEGAVTIRDINRALECQLPDDEAATIAGLVLHKAERIPDVGQRFVFHGFEFEILGREKNRITSLRLTPRPDTETN